MKIISLSWSLLSLFVFIPLIMLSSCSKHKEPIVATDDALYSLYTDVRTQQENLLTAALRSSTQQSDTFKEGLLIGSLELYPTLYIKSDGSIDSERLFAELSKEGLDVSLLRDLLPVFEDYINEFNVGKPSALAMRQAMQNNHISLASEHLEDLIKVLANLDVFLAYATNFSIRNNSCFKLVDGLSNALSDCKADRDRARRSLNIEMGFRGLISFWGSVATGPFFAFTITVAATEHVGEYAIRDQNIEQTYSDCVKRAHRDHGKKKK